MPPFLSVSIRFSPFQSVLEYFRPFQTDLFKVFQSVSIRFSMKMITCALEKMGARGVGAHRRPAIIHQNADDRKVY
ncbi:MAG: hypothetical protein EA363_08355 [Balneolaceae bacterium]|nr:MAG: hypothetical protein EA363_08355 [Balneolaceae bacterium]